MDSKEDKRELEPVVLGYSDGSIENSDGMCPFTCKLGGRPAWLDETSKIPCYSTTLCQECGSEMLMLVQTYVPLNDSPYDRAIYIWSCNRRSCTGKPGTAKVIRAHILNEEYALKLVKRKRGKAKLQPKKNTLFDSTNRIFSGNIGGKSKGIDFGSVWHSDTSTNANVSSEGLFTGPLFGKASSRTVMDTQAPMAGSSTMDILPNNNSSISVDSVSSLEQRIGEIDISLAKKASEPDPPQRIEWPDKIAHVQAKYLAFEAECLKDNNVMLRYQQEINRALEQASDMDGGTGESIHRHKDNGHGPGLNKEIKGEMGGSEEWADEKYERAIHPKGTDTAFSHFVSIVSRNSEQVIRYQFGGLPLFYTMQDNVAKLLNSNTKHNQNHGRNEVTTIESSDGDDNEDEDEEDDDKIFTKRLLQTYSTERLPRCSYCNGQRIYECQLMPALLTELSLSSYADKVPLDIGSNTDKNGLVGTQLLQSFDLGAEFGTMMIFVCENDCHGGKTGIDYLGHDAKSMKAYGSAEYYEELVLIQQEIHID